MTNQELEKYTATAREQKIPDEQIKAQLIKFGWPEAEVIEALAPKNTSNVTLPPPPVPRYGMWVAFQYIILFITLYLSATAVGGILHIAVDNIFKDKVNTYDDVTTYDNFLLNLYLAFIIVGFPIFAWLFVILKKQAIEKPGIKSLGARKFLIYLTLVGTFIIMIGNLISTIISFLNGDISTSSIFHLGVTFLIAGSIFVYLLLAVKEDRKVE